MGAVCAAEAGRSLVEDRKRLMRLRPLEPPQAWAGAPPCSSAGLATTDTRDERTWMPLPPVHARLENAQPCVRAGRSPSYRCLSYWYYCRIPQEVWRTNRTSTRRCSCSFPWPHLQGAFAHCQSVDNTYIRLSVPSRFPATSEDEQ